MAELTESLEDYLEVIEALIQLEGHAHTKDIAEKLQVKMPSVTVALRQLAARGFIEYSANHPVQLTPVGREIAESVKHRHQVLKRFFHEILGVEEEKASETACRLEHAVDEDIIQRFVRFTELHSGQKDHSERS